MLRVDFWHGTGFGSDQVLLADADATRDSIVAELQRLAAVSTDEDLVVVTFSGHGSTTHELVPHDADPSRLAETALPLEDIAKLLNQIRAATLVCVFDCCFSGGFGAKVLVAPTAARDLGSEVGLLEQIAGKGRIVLVASAPNERAYEDNALGHGFLTYHLLDALQGAPEVVSAGKIDLYKLLDHDPPSRRCVSCTPEGPAPGLSRQCRRRGVVADPQAWRPLRRCEVPRDPGRAAVAGRPWTSAGRWSADALHTQRPSPTG